jgi:hypothetical protein
MRLFILFAILLLAACRGEDGGGGTSSPTQTGGESVNFYVAGPTDLYFNQHDTISVLVENSGTTSVYYPIHVTMDGSPVPGVNIPTLAPGESYTGMYAIWAAQDLNITHVFVLSTDNGWSQTISIHYHGMSGG